MKLSAKIVTAIGLAVAILSALVTTVPAAFMPSGDPLGVRWDATLANGRAAVVLRMRGAPIGVNVALEVVTVGTTNGAFMAERVRKPEPLTVTASRHPSRGDTVHWSLSVFRAVSGGECPTGALPSPAFCWSGGDDPLRIVAPPGIREMTVGHWTVTPTAGEPDDDAKEFRRETIRWLSYVGIPVGVLAAVLPFLVAVSVSRPLSQLAYYEGIIATIKGSDSAETKRRRAILRWALIENMSYVDSLNRIKNEFKPADDLDAAVWHSSAMAEFQRIHLRLAGQVGGELRAATEAVAEFQIKKRDAEIAAGNVHQPGEPTVD
jgi:hypothetical protein